MSKLKFFLTLITVLIAVVPISVQVIRYSDDPVGLILPPTVSDLLQGSTTDFVNADFVDFAGMSFPLPMLTGDPVFTKEGTIKLTYNFTNPLDGKITIASMDAEVVCVDHGFMIGDVSIEPATLEAHETIDLDVTCRLTPQGIEHIKTQHTGQTSVNAEFKNYSVDLINIKITMPQRKLGTINIPLSVLSFNNFLFRWSTA